MILATPSYSLTQAASFLEIAFYSRQHIYALSSGLSRPGCTMQDKEHAIYAPGNNLVDLVFAPILKYTGAKGGSNPIFLVLWQRYNNQDVLSWC